MTTGSTSNHHALQPRDDRETLSALFDGELSADAMRFALKRLDHDAGWRDTCGRWQVIGDALRGEPSAAARPDFAAGVMRMLVDERQAAFAGVPASMQQASPSPIVSRRRWVGGAALAASVAMAAVLVARPFSEPTTPASGSEVVVSSSSSQPPSQAEPASASLDSNVPTTAAAPGQVRSVAVADAPQSATSRRNARTARVPSRPARVVPASAPPSTAEAGVAVATATPETGRQPFHPPADDIVTRPWPRAVLTDSAAAGALTVDFGSGTGSPSFYPFEPRLPSQEPDPATPQATEPQR